METKGTKPFSKPASCCFLNHTSERIPIEELIKAGGDIDVIDRFECSPLHYAKVYKRVASFLEKKGVNMKEIPEMYDRAKEAIEEIMEKRNVNELKMHNCRR